MTAARALAESLNIHRRHLTIEQRRRLVMDELKRDPRQSDRVLAKKATVHPETVDVARRRLVESGAVSETDAIIGSDGVAQPAKKLGPGQPPRLTRLADLRIIEMYLQLCARRDDPLKRDPRGKVKRIADVLKCSPHMVKRAIDAYRANPAGILSAPEYAAAKAPLLRMGHFRSFAEAIYDKRAVERAIMAIHNLRDSALSHSRTPKRLNRKKKPNICTK